MPKKPTAIHPSEKGSAGKAEKSAGKAPRKLSKRILIVEDEHPLAHALELKFSHEGYDTVIANNGMEGLREAKAGNFAVILLDLIMPELDGFGFMERLGKKTPVIVLSNLGQDEDKKRAEALGAVAYFVKSNTPISEIIKTVKTIIR